MNNSICLVSNVFMYMLHFPVKIKQSSKQPFFHIKPPIKTKKERKKYELKSQNLDFYVQNTKNITYLFTTNKKNATTKGRSKSVFPHFSVNHEAENHFQSELLIYKPSILLWR